MDVLWRNKSVGPGSNTLSCGYRMEEMIRVVRMADLLKSDRSLARAVEQIGMMIGFSPGWLAQDACTPSASTVGRYRFKLDCGLCIVMRKVFADLAASGGLIYMLCDASPRAGREWLFAEMYCITKQGAKKFRSARNQMLEMRRRGEWNAFDAGVAMGVMRTKLFHHVLIPVALGARNCSLASKFVATIHAVHLECAPMGWRECEMVVDMVRNMCTDMGTESGMTYVPPIDMTKAFPWWKERPLITDDEDCANMPVAPQLHLKNAFPTPGIEHTCFNALKQIVGKLKHYKEWLRKASAVGKCFTSTYYTDRLKRLCLSSPEASITAAQLDSFSVKPDEGRFSNLMEFLDELLPMKRGMQRFYNDALFRGADVDKETDGDFVDLALVTQFIVDSEQWHYGSMLLCLGAGWLEVQYFSRGCACHRAADVDADNCYSYYQRRAAMHRESGVSVDCPAKGLHADEFACGKGKDILSEAHAKYGRFLIADICDVTPEGRHRIIGDWDVGVDQSMYVAVFKFSIHQQLPLLLCGMCNRDPEKAAGPAQRAIAEWEETSESSAHCDYVRDVFKNEALFAQIRVFSETRDVVDKPLLDELLDELDLVRFNEISVESLHRVGGIVAKKAIHHGPAHISNALRGREISTRGGGRWTWAEYATACRESRSTQKALGAFGLHGHPMVTEERDKFCLRSSRRRRDGFVRDTALMSMFYRTDAPTMFNDNAGAKAAIEQNSEKVLRALKDSLANPLSEAMSENAALEEKTEAVIINYALRHFKDCLLHTLSNSFGAVCTCFMLGLSYLFTAQAN